MHLGLDGFRRFNAEHGRAAGDAVLAEVALRLRQSTRGGDVLARLGGDEFAVLLREAGAADDVAARLLTVLADPVEVSPSLRAQVGASIGVATVSDRGPDLMRAAEQAMTAAKNAGGGCLRVWDPSTVDARRDDELAAARLQRGLADELEVHYQPTVDLDTAAVTGVECLVRWRRDGELVPPDDFIGLAERHGLIAELGRRVLATAVRDAPALASAAGHDLVIAVNVSGPQLVDPELLPAVLTAVQRLAPQRLVLEMTESILVAEDAATQQALDALVAAGAFLCVDDFGTGYATLAYLRRRPFTAFKIDRSYVRDIETDRRTGDLVEGLVLLAAATGMGLVAEGVETAGQAQMLRRMGAPTQQGFLHARPQPLDEVLTSVRRLAASLAQRALTGP
nr:bifunctional diguanylate cyclase/phosphodiesterase [Kineococcus siccus]